MLWSYFWVNHIVKKPRYGFSAQGWLVSVDLKTGSFQKNLPGWVGSPWKSDIFRFRDNAQ